MQGDAWRKRQKREKGSESARDEAVGSNTRDEEAFVVSLWCEKIDSP